MMLGIARILVAAMLLIACSAVAETDTNNGIPVSRFLTPDGQFDLDAARWSGYEGSLDIEGFQSAIDSTTGQQMVDSVLTWLYERWLPVHTGDKPADIVGASNEGGAK